MGKYHFTDLLFKICYKLIDYLLKVKWKILLGSIGKGSYLRAGVTVIGNPKRIYIGDHFKVYQNSVIAIGKGEVRIGNNGLIGVGTYINCGNEKLTIGHNVAIGPYCKIFTYSHHYSEYGNPTESYKNADVFIEDNVLIGSNTVILPGVRIGKGAVVGSCSLVNKNIEKNSIVGGIPVRPIL